MDEVAHVAIVVATNVPPEVELVEFLYQRIVSETPTSDPTPAWQVLKVKVIADAVALRQYPTLADIELLEVGAYETTAKVA